MKDNQFKCVGCKEMFEKKPLDKEALEQLGVEVLGTKSRDCLPVCDYCFHKYFYEYLGATPLDEL